MKFKVVILCLACVAVQNLYTSPPDRLFNLLMNKLVKGDCFPCETKVTDTHLRSAMALLGSPFSDYEKIKGISDLCKNRWKQKLDELDENECKRMYDSLKREEDRRKKKRGV